MHIKDLIPEAGFVQRNYCEDCGKLLDLEFSRYDEEISAFTFKSMGCRSLGAQLAARTTYRIYPVSR